jgi:Peptidyl-tRNA hydrolase PTH2
MPLVHYIIVRRDLPFGVILSMVAHAAGESFYQLRPRSSGEERRTFSPEVGGSSPSGGFKVDDTIAVVLGARNEGRVSKAARILEAAGIEHVVIRETDGAYVGQAMALGVVPCDVGTVVRDLLSEYQMFKEYEGT